MAGFELADQAHHDLAAHIGEKAENLFLSKQMLCTEAVVSALNDGLHGGLSQGQAAALTAGFTEGLGGSGCLCGAVSGAVMALGLFLGKGQNHAARGKVQKAAKQVHDEFKQAHRSTCCRVLSRPVKDDAKAHFQQCARFSGQAAEMAARIILEKRPELAGQADSDFLDRRQNSLTGRVKSLLRKVG